MALDILSFTQAQAASVLSPVDVGVHLASAKNERMPSQSALSYSQTLRLWVQEDDSWPTSIPHHGQTDQMKDQLLQHGYLER